MSITKLFEAAKAASPAIARASTVQKNAALEAIARKLMDNKASVVAANQKDLAKAEKDGIASGLLDRLKLDDKRVEGLADALRDLVELADPVGEVVRGRTLANGIKIQQVRVPFGVLGCIYEARPNVTVDIAGIAIKSGNAALLRGGSLAEQTNKVLVDLIQQGLAEAGLPTQSVQTIDEFGREGAQALMQARGFVDVLIPRGSAKLIQTVVTESKVPVIETGDGMVHIFVDASADLSNAVPIVVNSKAQRPSVCNSLETLLVHESIASSFLPDVAQALAEAGVTIHGCSKTAEIIACEPATEEDWATEYLSLDLSVKVVSSLDEALAHIAKYSTRHTESILTNDIANAERFLQEVDSAAVMVNTSTRFTDGGEFGFGAEVGISTQKLHARGPMGLQEMTSTKWLIRGSGQVRS